MPALGAAAAARVRRLGAAFAADARRLRPAREVALGVLAVAVIVWAFRLVNNEFLYEVVGFDEMHFVWGGWSILKGLVPYRDFLEFKPPLVFITHALALALHGFRDLQFRWFFLYFPLLSLIALYLAMLTRKIDKLCALALILAIIQLWVNHQFHDSSLSDTESIGLTYYFFGLACLIARTRFGDRLKAVGAGLLVCCVFSKEPFLPSVFFTWLGCFVLDAERPTLRADASRYLRSTAIGAGVVVLALCLYLVPTGGMTHYLRMVSGYARIYRDPQHSFCVMYGRFTPTGTLNDLKVQWDQVRGDFLNLGMLGYLLPFWAVYALYVPRRSKLLALLGILTFFAALWAVTASKCLWWHYYNMAMSGLFFALVLGLDAMARRITSPTVNRLAGWILLAGVFVPIWPRLDQERSRHTRSAYPNAYEETVPGALAFIAANTKPGDRIFTTGGPALYVQADRRSAIRESAILDAVMYGYPGNSDEERLSGLKAQLERNMPKVVVLDGLFEWDRPKHMSLLVMPFLTSHRYRKVTDRIWLRP